MFVAVTVITDELVPMLPLCFLPMYTLAAVSVPLVASLLLEPVK